MSRRTQENIVACLFLGVFVLAIVLAARYGPRARVVPLPIATIGAVMAIVQLVLQNRSSAGNMKVDALEFLTGRAKSEVVETDAAKKDVDEGRWRRELTAFGLVLLLMAMVILIGPLPSIFLFTAGYMGLKRQYSWPWSIAFAAVFVLAVYVVFALVLQVQLDRSELTYLLGM
jgi:hypothetical protein